MVPAVADAFFEGKTETNEKENPYN